MEKRNSNRIPKNLKVAFPCCNKLYSGTVTDLSESGMLIYSEVNLPIKSRFDILMSIKKKIIKIPAVFVRLEKEGNHYKGMGVKLLNPPEKYLEFVLDLNIQRQYKILLMDDEKVIREGVGRLLTFEGYEVECAKDCEEAIELYKKAMETLQSFDAVILDLTIHGRMGGKEVFKKLLEIDPNVKAIVSSGYLNDHVLVNFKEYGFMDFFNKASKPEELFKALNRVVKR